MGFEGVPVEGLADKDGLEGVGGIWGVFWGLKEGLKVLRLGKKMIWGLKGLGKLKYIGDV